MAVNEDLQKVKKLSSTLNVLYAEDEQDIRETTTELLKIFFNDVIVAVDGEDAKEKLTKHTPDLIITDIQMPKMDGMQLIEYIKQNFEDLPVIITTAFSNQEYIFRSFDLGVSQYIIKPIKQENLIQVIYNVSKAIDNAKKAKKLEEYKIKEIVDYSSEHIIEQLLGSLKTPCIIFTGDKMRYSNNAFKEQIGDASVFDKKPGFISSCREYNEDDLNKNKVSISKHGGRKVFKVVKSNINIDEIVQVSKLYIFMDITLEEYQKVKIQSYTDILESFVIKTKYHQEQTPQIIDDNKDSYIPADKNKLTINDEENELLRRSHTHKTTAEDYFQELDDEVLKELQELDELDKDFADSIYMLRDDYNFEGIKHMSEHLEKYAHEISLLFEFKDLSYAIKSLATLFYTIEESKIDEKKLSRISIILEGIKDDLATWRKVIFIEKSALDIHYLDSSLFSACLQIELLLSDESNEMESEEDDFVLF